MKRLSSTNYILLIDKYLLDKYRALKNLPVSANLKERMKEAFAVLGEILYSI